MPQLDLGSSEKVGDATQVYYLLERSIKKQDDICLKSSRVFFKSV